jgi:hypothetical protein
MMEYNVSFFGIVLIIMIVALRATAGSEFTGNDLYRSCTANTNTADGNVHQGYCLGFLSGLLGGMTLQAGLADRPYSLRICTEDKAVTTGQYRLIFIKSANEHPERLHLSAEVVASMAFEDAFPCPRPAPPKVSRIPTYPTPDQLLPAR